MNEQSRSMLDNLVDSENLVDSDNLVDVLIVGAGLAGLMMAAQLLRQGVYPLIIDRKMGPDTSGTLSYLQARSMELLHQLGLEDEVRAAGAQWTRLKIEPMDAVLDAGDLAQKESPYQEFWVIRTAVLERMLIARLTAQACKIHWGTELHAFVERDDRVAVTLVRPRTAVIPETIPQQLRAHWVVGADGPQSRVRSLLGISFEGTRYGTTAYEVRTVPTYEQTSLIESDGAPLPTFSIRKGQWAFMLPESNSDRIHLYGALPRRSSSRESSGALRGKIVSAESRRAAQISTRRCFLIGRAAHQRLPDMLQEPNGGFQDAWNLGWKLAGVVSGRFRPGILRTYQAERFVSGAGLTEISLDRRARIAGFLLRMGWPGIAGLHFFVNRLMLRPQRFQKLFRELSGLATHYRHSPLSAHYSLTSTIRAGDRFPWHPLFDEKSKSWTDTRAIFQKTGFTLVILGNAGAHALHILSRWIKQKYPQGMGLYSIPFSPHNQGIFADFSMNPSSIRAVVVRPDTYIGYLTDSLNTSLIDSYLSEVIGWKLFKQFE